MKNPQFKVKKKVRLASIKKLKNNIREIVHDCLLDIEYYIIDDIMKHLKKEGIIYAKDTKKNKKKGKGKKKR